MRPRHLIHIILLVLRFKIFEKLEKQCVARFEYLYDALIKSFKKIKKPKKLYVFSENYSGQIQKNCSITINRESKHLVNDVATSSNI